MQSSAQRFRAQELTLRPSGCYKLVTAHSARVQGMSQTGKAFILILTADVLMGYHSEEGWTASLELLADHYTIEVPVRLSCCSLCTICGACVHSKLGPALQQSVCCVQPALCAHIVMRAQVP